MQAACRLCLGPAPPGSALLYSASSGDQELANRVFQVTRVTLTRALELPVRACSACLHDLQHAETFRRRCARSEATLLGALRPPFAVPASALDPPLPPADDPLKPPQLDDSPFADFDDEKYDSKITTDVFENTCQSESDQIEGKAVITQNSLLGHACTTCGKRLKTKASLKRHTVTMHEGRRRICRVTGYGASRLHHCPECDYTTKHSQSLVYHVRRHTGERPHRCECGAAFAQPASLAAHRKRHSDVTHYTCTECGKQFKHKDVYERHKIVHSGFTHWCTLCGKGLKSRQTLESHMNRHLGLRNFSCEDCGACFVTASELHNHRKKHDAQARTRFQCDLCEYKTYRKKALNIHIKRHTGERAYQCAHCLFDCYTRSELTLHLRTHTKEKNYQCPNCEQKFRYSTSLNKHMKRIHDINFKWSNTVDRSVIKTLSAMNQ